MLRYWTLLRLYVLLTEESAVRIRVFILANAFSLHCNIVDIFLICSYYHDDDSKKMLNIGSDKWPKHYQCNI